VDTRERNKLARRRLRYGQDSYELEQMRQKYTKNEVIDQWDLFWNEETKSWFHSFYDRNGKRDAYDTRVADPLDPWRAALVADPVSSEADFFRASGQVGAMLENIKIDNYENPFASREEEIGEKDVRVDSKNMIRESIRRLILEEITVEKPLSYVDKLVDMDGVVQVKGYSDNFVILINDANGKRLAEIETILADDKEPFVLNYQHSVHEAGYAYGGHVVVYAKNYSDDGFGILAYEIALELCSLYSEGLCSDRFEVSPDAFEVWKNYNYRNDVLKKQLDMLEYPMTSDTTDDASIVSSVRAYYDWDDYFGSNITAGLIGPKDYVKNIGYVQNWFGSLDPLSKLYYKNTFPILDELLANSMDGAELIQCNEQMMKDLRKKLSY